MCLLIDSVLLEFASMITQILKKYSFGFTLHLSNTNYLKCLEQHLKDHNNYGSPHFCINAKIFNASVVDS